MDRSLERVVSRRRDNINAGLSLRTCDPNCVAQQAKDQKATNKHANEEDRVVGQCGK